MDAVKVAKVQPKKYYPFDRYGNVKAFAPMNENIFLALFALIMYLVKNSKCIPRVQIIMLQYLYCSGKYVSCQQRRVNGNFFS